MANYAVPIARLIEEFEKLPGIGHKTAQRLAFYVLGMKKEKAELFANAVIEAKEKIRFCSICGNLTDVDPCLICNSVSRDTTTICVVESPKDIVSMERIREYKGLYHVLHGVISPMDGKGPNDINIKSLVNRVNDTDIKEIIIATNPNVEGEATAIYISRLMKPLEIKTTRIAHGLPIGGDLEYADEITLAKSLEGRREI